MFSHNRDGFLVVGGVLAGAGAGMISTAIDYAPASERTMMLIFGLIVAVLGIFTIIKAKKDSPAKRGKTE